MGHRLLLVFFISILNANLFAGDSYMYAVYFTNKAHNSFSLSHPQSFLSAQCIERRTRQHIGFFESDLPVSKLYADSLLTFGVHNIKTSKWLNCSLISASDTTIIQRIASLGFVSKVELVKSPFTSLRKSESKFEVLTDVDFKDFNPDEYYGASSNQNQMIHVDFLHKRGYKGDSVDIAVFDAGFYNANGLAGFDSLFKTSRFKGSWDLEAQNANVFDDGSHGTSCLSCMAANQPGKMIGSAPNANYALFRTEVGSSETLEEEYNWVFAAEFAESGGADVFSTSLGYTQFDDATTNHTYADLDGNTTPIAKAANVAARGGIVVLNSAGNEGANSWYFISTPADADSILAVGAVNELRQYAKFSGKGPNAAGHVKPDVCARGVGTAVYNTAGEIYNGSGTSFSCPVLAGGAACLRQAFPNVPGLEIMETIRESAHLFKMPNDTFGYGIPDLAVAYMILSNKYNYHNHDNLLADLDVFPNPFSSELNVYVGKPMDEKLQLAIFDFSGKLIQSQDVSFSNNSNQFVAVNTLNLNQGVYLLKLQGKSFFDVKRIVKE